MHPRMFKRMVAKYGGNNIKKEDGMYKAYWDAYDSNSHKWMFLCFGRLLQIIKSPSLIIGDLACGHRKKGQLNLTLFIIGNWLYYKPS